MKTLFHKPSWPWALVCSRYEHEWLGFHCNWDYYNVITTINILTFELCLEIVHHRWHKSRRNKNGINFSIDRD